MGIYAQDLHLVRNKCFAHNKILQKNAVNAVSFLSVSRVDKMESFSQETSQVSVSSDQELEQ